MLGHCQKEWYLHGHPILEPYGTRVPISLMTHQVGIICRRLGYSSLKPACDLLACRLVVQICGRPVCGT